MKKANKIALVTGGSRGLGKNMVQHIAQKGIDIILTYNNKKEEADVVVKEVEATGVKAASLHLNVAHSKTFDHFFEGVKTVLKEKFQTDKFNFLINNAGVALYAPLEKTTEEQFDNIINIHFKGTFFLTQKALPLIADEGSIINISSGLARFAFPGSSVYGSTKAAIEQLTRYEAKELASRKIRVNVVAPGAIETDFGGGRTRDDKEVNKRVAEATALGRAGLPNDIGGVVAFLCTKEASWINGQRIEVSGGMML